MKNAAIALMTCLMTLPALAQEPPIDQPNAPRPIAALDTVRMEEMTWMEIRDAIRAGKTTAILGAGGLEQRGPYVNISNHNNSIRVETELIARRLGNALVAPSVGIGPGNPAAPGNPGSFSLRRDVFKMVLTDIATTLKQNGFRHIILIGDNGGNQVPMREVAAELNAAWAGSQTTVHHVPEYYATHGMIDKTGLRELGINTVPDGGSAHTSYRVEALNLLANPDNVRLKQRMAAGKTTVTGVDLLPVEKTIAIANKLLEMKVGPTVKAIQDVVSRASAPQKAAQP